VVSEAKDLAYYVLSNSSSRRHCQVTIIMIMLKGKGKLELYEQNKSARYIAEALRMSLRDISTILEKHGLSQRVAIVKDNGNNNDNNKSDNEKAIRAYELYDKENGPIQVAIQLGLSEKQATRYCVEYWRLRCLNKLSSVYKELKEELKGNPSALLKLQTAKEGRSNN
jgi:hypothetical protein